MRTLLASSTLLFTIFASMSFGIACGYVAVVAILRLLGHRPAQQQTAPTGAIANPASSH